MWISQTKIVFIGQSTFGSHEHYSTFCFENKEKCRQTTKIDIEVHDLPENNKTNDIAIGKMEIKPFVTQGHYPQELGVVWSLCVHQISLHYLIDISCFIFIFNPSKYRSEAARISIHSFTFYSLFFFLPHSPPPIRAGKAAATTKRNFFVFRGTATAACAIQFE